MVVVDEARVEVTFPSSLDFTNATRELLGLESSTSLLERWARCTHGVGPSMRVLSFDITPEGLGGSNLGLAVAPDRAIVRYVLLRRGLWARVPHFWHKINPFSCLLWRTRSCLGEAGLLGYDANAIDRELDVIDAHEFDEARLVAVGVSHIKVTLDRLRGSFLSAKIYYRLEGRCGRGITKPSDGINTERLVAPTLFKNFAKAGERLRVLFDDVMARPNATSGRLHPVFAPAVSTMMVVDDDGPHPLELPISLFSILRPFEGKLHPPFVKVTADAGAPLGASDFPNTIDEMINKLVYSSERRSVVLRLERLFESHHAGVGPFGDLLRPFLPIGSGSGETTAHVYISNSDASALDNHTDVTEIVVFQLLGQKEWLYCTADEEGEGNYDNQRLPFLKTTLPSKLSKCTTYTPTEMADGTLKCQRVVTAPGDALFLPRRTVHSARTVSNEVSVHLTIGIAGRSSSFAPNHRRRLEVCANSCDDSCDPSCDEASCDGAGCDGSSCDLYACDDDSCDYDDK